MFISRKSHEAILQEKEKTLQQMREEIAWLRNFIQPAERVSKVDYASSADYVLSGAPSQPPQTPQVDLAVLMERDRLLSGTY